MSGPLGFSYVFGSEEYPAYAPSAGNVSLAEQGITIMHVPSLTSQHMLCPRKHVLCIQEHSQACYVLNRHCKMLSPAKLSRRAQRIIR
jgi:hypothetical protein